MNLIFLLIAAALTGLALVLVLPPIWRGRDVPEDDIDQRNILIARQRLAELKANRQSGGISQAQYDEQVLELEQSLLDDLSLKTPVVVSPRQGRWMVFVLVFIIPVLSGSLYWTLGNFQAVGHSEEMAAAPLSRPSDQDIIKMVEGLADRLKSEPDNAEGWLMLGKSYKYLEQYPKSAEAFGNAYRLLGDKPDVMLLYAEAIAFASNKNLAGKPNELIFKALEKEPDNMNGLWLGGLARIQQGDTASALSLWRKLESLLPPGSEARKEMQNAIADLSGHAQSASTTKSPKETKTASAGISVEVSLAPELQTAASPGDTVFVYAQALAGPKMPLAITRRQVGELPVKIVLDDSMAMMPAMKLTHFAEVKLLARVSKSGQAVSQPGDLIGTIEKVAVSDSAGHKIVIDRRVE
ncbi:MAG: c-type cytochrome biogenesis protein CcmI [Gammaproteobacteria bacterium]